MYWQETNEGDFLMAAHDSDCSTVRHLLQKRIPPVGIQYFDQR